MEKIMESQQGKKENKMDNENTTEISGDASKNVELSTFKIKCSKHGNITNGSVSLNFATKHEDGKVHETHYIYCLQCVNDLLKKFQDSGEFGKIEIVPIYSEKKEEITEKSEDTSENKIDLV
jgi:hypothetical protein